MCPGADGPVSLCYTLAHLIQAAARWTRGQTLRHAASALPSCSWAKNRNPSTPEALVCSRTWPLTSLLKVGMHTSWKVHVRFTLVYISDVGDCRLKACWQYWLLCKLKKKKKEEKIIQQYISSQTKQISNIWILTSLISKRCGHTFHMPECYYLLCLISVVGYQDQASSYVVLFERIDLKKELYLSLVREIISDCCKSDTGGWTSSFLCLPPS